MSPHNEFYDRLHLRIQSDFPKTFKLLDRGALKVDWKHLLSPFEVSISKESHQKMVRAVKELFELSRTSEYKNPIKAPLDLNSVSNYSVLMSYDFHSSSDGKAKLIEVNTNASGFLIACLGLAGTHKESVYELPQVGRLKAAFLSEAGADGKLNVAIVDDDIESQKMKIEFHLYKELFETWGWTAEICEASELVIEGGKVLTPQGTALDLIYNRSTDFYFQEDRHETLRRAWREHLAVISPQPQEYAWLADKSRLLELQRTRSTLSTDLQEVLLASYEVNDFPDHEELWKKRRSMFFKPKNSFGGKSAYRGQSLSHKVFDRLMKEDPMIQEYFPPEKQEEWKFDLRCFAYKDEVHLIAARLYQGQVTNFSTPFGGFCPVRLKS